MNKTTKVILELVFVGLVVVISVYVTIELKEYFEALECITKGMKLSIKVGGFFLFLLLVGLYAYFKHWVLLAPPFVLALAVIISMFVTRCWQL